MATLYGLKVDKIQRRVTRCLPGLVDKSYDERLCELQLPSLGHRQLRGDLILLFKGTTIF